MSYNKTGINILGNQAAELEHRIKSENVVDVDFWLKANNEDLIEDVAAQYINETLMSIPDRIAEDVTTIGPADFSTLPISNARFPNCTSVGRNAFARCPELRTAALPKVQTLEDYTFYLSPKLNRVSAVMAERIGPSCFSGCSNLQLVIFPKCSYIDTCAFQNCTNLFTVSIPNCQTIQTDAFAGCTNLMVFPSFQNVTSVNIGAFANCGIATGVSLPKVKFVGIGAFNNCSNLPVVRLDTVRFIYPAAFYGCTNLKSVYLNKSEYCQAPGGSIFDSTPITDSSYTGSFGSIYVPASLLSQYQSATNWVVYSSRFAAMPE